MAFEKIVQTMIEMGILELFFPWLLITSLTYGTLNRYGAFEEESVIGAVAISVGFIGLAGIYTFLPPGMFAQFGAAIGFAIFGMLGLAMMLGMAGVDITEMFESGDGVPMPAKLGIPLVILAFIGVLATQFDISFLLEGVEDGSSLLMQILTLIFIIVIVAIVFRGGGE